MQIYQGTSGSEVTAQAVERRLKMCGGPAVKEAGTMRSPQRMLSIWATRSLLGGQLLNVTWKI